MEELAFHVSRPMRWDSNHVVILNDDLKELCAELVRSGKLERSFVGLDFFDGTLNRIGAYIIGGRAALKAFLLALLLDQLGFLVHNTMPDTLEGVKLSRR